MNSKYKVLDRIATTAALAYICFNAAAVLALTFYSPWIIYNAPLLEILYPHLIASAALLVVMSLYFFLNKNSSIRVVLFRKIIFFTSMAATAFALLMPAIGNVRELAV